eukprot:jgi/Hompol1/2260/HPOL_005912-RA
MIYGAGIAHLLFWSAIAGMAYVEMSSDGKSFLSKPVNGILGNTPESEDDLDQSPTAKLRRWSTTPDGRWFKLVVTGSLASVGILFLVGSHRHASAYVSQMDLLHGKTLRIKSSALIGNPYTEVPFVSASLSSNVYTGIGQSGAEVADYKAAPWYREMFGSQKPNIIRILINDKPTRFKIDRVGTFSNPEFVDKLFRNKALLSDKEA